MENLQPILNEVKLLIETLTAEKQNDNQVHFLAELTNSKPNNDTLLALLQKESLYKNLKADKDRKKALISEVKKIVSQAKDSTNVAATDKQNIIYYRTTYEDFHIEMFLKKPEGYTVPAEVFTFIDAIEDTQDVIKENCKSDKEKDHYLNRLFGIAEIGGTSTYNAFAQKSLQSFKESFVRTKWWSLKFPFVKDLAAQMGLMVLIFYVIILIIRLEWISPKVFDKLHIETATFINWIFVMIGASVGTWMSFAIVRSQKTIEEIKSLKDNIPHPFFRLAVVALVASAFYLFFIMGVFTFEIGKGDTLSTKNIGMQGFENLALLVGVFIGFSENNIGQRLRKRIESFTSKF